MQVCEFIQNINLRLKHPVGRLIGTEIDSTNCIENSLWSTLTALYLPFPPLYIHRAPELLCCLHVCFPLFGFSSNPSLFPSAAFPPGAYTGVPSSHTGFCRQLLPAALDCVRCVCVRLGVYWLYFGRERSDKSDNIPGPLMIFCECKWSAKAFCIVVSTLCNTRAPIG